MRSESVHFKKLKLDSIFESMSLCITTLSNNFGNAGNVPGATRWEAGVLSTVLCCSPPNKKIRKAFISIHAAARENDQPLVLFEPCLKGLS